MTDFETLLYEERNRVGWITLNRPQAHNAFSSVMQRELRGLWRELRSNTGVDVIVVTGAGEKAFTTGIDRGDAVAPRLSGAGDKTVGNVGSPYMFDDFGDYVCPKKNDLWKPIICAVNGMACGGAFYLLAECDIIIASENATFFDPHVTYGMVCGFEMVHMMQRMPMGEALRIGLMGAHERMSAARAHQIGFVSEVVPAEQLIERAGWIAERVADAPTLVAQGTVRAAYLARELGREQALSQAYALVGLGTREEALAAGQEKFLSPQRPKWELR